MDQQFQTSFIPKKPITEARAPVTRGSASIFSVGATILFVIAVILFGGSYFYKVSMIKQRDTLTAEIATKTKTFDADFLRQVAVLDKRIIASNDVLARHTLVSPIFAKLAQLSLKTVQFTKFDLSQASTSGSQIAIKMAGRAVNYAAIASQSDVLAGVGANKNTYFINPIFSNLNLDDRARVSFDLTFSVDADLVSYSTYISRLTSDPSQPQ